MLLSEKACNKTIVLLHGYRQTNSWIYKKLIDSIPQDFTVLSNAILSKKKTLIFTKNALFSNDNRTI